MTTPRTPSATPSRRRRPTPAWRIGDDVTHRELGHGWVQGAGHGVVTVRFETRGTGPGPARTFASDTDDIAPANPLDSLDWPDYLAALAESRVRAAGSTTSRRGSPAANAAIVSTRAWLGGSHGTITAPASTRSRPGP